MYIPLFTRNIRIVCISIFKTNSCLYLRPEWYHAARMRFVQLVGVEVGVVAPSRYPAPATRPRRPAGALSYVLFFFMASPPFFLFFFCFCFPCGVSFFFFSLLLRRQRRDVLYLVYMCVDFRLPVCLPTCLPACTGFFRVSCVRLRGALCCVGLLCFA